MPAGENARMLSNNSASWEGGSQLNGLLSTFGSIGLLSIAAVAAGNFALAASEAVALQAAQHGAGCQLWKAWIRGQLKPG